MITPIRITRCRENSCSSTRLHGLWRGVFVGVFWFCISVSAEQPSCKPHYYGLKDFEVQRSLWSPDHSKRIELLQNWKLRVESAGKVVGEISLPDDPVNTEIKWSSDSRAFFVETSGNAIGGQVVAYAVTSNGLQELRGPETVAEEFAKQHYCKSRGNIMHAVRWEQGSQALLLMPQVYETGDCGPDLGYSEGYLVEAESGAILKKYPEKVIEAEWKKCWPDVPNSKKLKPDQ